MRKIYTFKSIAVCALAMLANVAMGQNLKVTSNGKAVSNGDVIELGYEFEDYSVPEIGAYNFYFTWDPHLEASTESGSENLIVTVTSINDSNGFQLCWPMGCKEVEPGKSVSSEGEITTNPVDLMIHKEVIFYEEGLKPTEGGEAKVTLECGDETIELTIKLLLEDINAVDENIADSNEQAVYYSLDGIQIEKPTVKGMYILRKGSKAKVILKK